jgi:hypothetical protein
MDETKERYEPLMLPQNEYVPTPFARTEKYDLIHHGSNWN